MSGLDNFLVDGIESIVTLNELVAKVYPSSESILLKNELSKIESYIKSNFAMHVKSQDECRSHCSNCALSNIRDNKLQKICLPHFHTKFCNDCDNIIVDLE